MSTPESASAVWHTLLDKITNSCLKFDNLLSDEKTTSLLTGMDFQPNEIRYLQDQLNSLASDPNCRLLPYPFNEGILFFVEHRNNGSRSILAFNTTGYESFYHIPEASTANATPTGQFPIMVTIPMFDIHNMHPHHTRVGQVIAVQQIIFEPQLQPSYRIEDYDYFISVKTQLGGIKYKCMRNEKDGCYKYIAFPSSFYY